MTKDEMKNRISMALKDPILQQGFEIICKNLAKLESRNDKLVKMYNEVVERQNSFQQSLYKDLAELEKENAEKDKAIKDRAKIILAREKRIAELEKENAELKTRVVNQKSFILRIREKFNLGEIDRKEIEGYLESEQLTKAKEIIKSLMLFAEIDCREYEEAYKKAAQFLNSEVEK